MFTETFDFKKKKVLSAIPGDKFLNFIEKTGHCSNQGQIETENVIINIVLLFLWSPCSKPKIFDVPNNTKDDNHHFLCVLVFIKKKGLFFSI